MNDEAVRELAGRAGIAVEWSDYAERTAQRIGRKPSPHSRSTGASLRHGRRLGGEPPPLETSRLPPLITATTGQPVRGAGCAEQSRIGCGSLRGRHDCGASRCAATPRGVRCPASRRRATTVFEFGEPSASVWRSRRRAASPSRDIAPEAAPVGACGAALRPAPRRRRRHRRHSRRHARLPARLPAFGPTRSRSARCTRCSPPIQTISARIRRRAGCSTIPFMPTRDHCSVEARVAKAAHDAGVAAAAAELERQPLIDWPRSRRAAKCRSSARLFDDFSSTRSRRGHGNAAGRRISRNFARPGRALLARHALFEALHAARFAADGSAWNWRDWPSRGAIRQARK